MSASAKRKELEETFVKILFSSAPPFSDLCQFISKYHLHSGEIILSCYVALILQMKDLCSANLTFRAHN